MNIKEKDKKVFLVILSLFDSMIKNVKKEFFPYFLHASSKNTNLVEKFSMIVHRKFSEIIIVNRWKII